MGVRVFVNAGSDPDHSHPDPSLARTHARAHTDTATHTECTPSLSLTLAHALPVVVKLHLELVVAGRDGGVGLDLVPLDARPVVVVLEESGVFWVIEGREVGGGGRGV
jgi:hypothetical protein